MSKSQKIELSIIALAAIIFLTVFLNLKNLHIKFYNKTGEDIDSLVVGDTYIGQIKKDSSTEFINFKGLLFDSGFPREKITAIINKKKLHHINGSWCASGRKMVTEGEIIYDIQIDSDKNGNPYLNLRNPYQ